jgi:hypothetical protein
MEPAVRFIEYFPHGELACGRCAVIRAKRLVKLQGTSVLLKVVQEEIIHLHHILRCEVKLGPET